MFDSKVHLTLCSFSPKLTLHPRLLVFGTKRKVILVARNGSQFAFMQPQKSCTPPTYRKKVISIWICSVVSDRQNILIPSHLKITINGQCIDKKHLQINYFFWWSTKLEMCDWWTLTISLQLHFLLLWFCKTSWHFMNWRYKKRRYIY